ncbi:peptidoglycan/LPS O-acetylase OafA/YrhL [Azospirillum agricola]|uniref:acyltransferase family protein n=1 Tax=Azospirillum agricola TaxID=1720247 RepID=UPI001AE269AA|nr:acyltransferase [Azospirillum agricola]MBP2230860.1 peptidoglycan/LPS O-acetylase OafA/YrhL [Azospirillum agricola]
MAKIVSLEAARFVAALLVVLHHATLIPVEPRFLGYQPLNGYFFPGHMGVEFFFVLSGFIIMHVHQGDLGRPKRLGSYLWRRASRIYLPYWAVLAVLIPAYLFTGMGTADKRDPLYLLSSILLIPQSSQPVLGVAWTLTHEVLFYALFGLFILNRRFMVPAIAGWVALILANQYVWPLPFPGSFLLSLYNLLFLAGVGGALLIARRAVPKPALVLLLGVAVVAVAWVLELGGHLGWDVQRFVYGAASLLVVLGLVELERSGRLRVPSWLGALGAASYAIYLVHAVVQSMVLNLAFHGRPDGWLSEGTLFAVLLLLPVAAGLVFHHGVERPLTRLVRGVPSKRSAGGPVTAGT